MTELGSDFLRAVVDRGFLHQCTDIEALDELARKGTVTGYIGFDCTAPSLHVGSLVQIMLLRLFQRTGHRPIVLLGGATTKVGDPSGKDESRALLTEDEIARNMAGIRNVFERFLGFGDGPTDAVIVNNADWLDGLGYIPFLRDYGRHFSINRMLGFESVKLRLEREQPLSFLEFNYLVLQAYDFLELARRFGCALQMGGSDQWGNIVGGVELARRLDDRTLFGLTAPLITTASGEKMGKTARGAVWLDAEALSPYDYWQYWRNTADADVGRFLRLFTELPLDEVAWLERLEGAELNEAKKRLADEATGFCHGPEAAAAAAETARETFAETRGGILYMKTPVAARSTFDDSGLTIIREVLSPDGSMLEMTATGLPVVNVARVKLEEGIPAFELFQTADLSASRSEARKLIRGGGARVNDVVVTDEQQQVTLADVSADGVIRLSAGRKRHALVRAV